MKHGPLLCFGVLLATAASVTWGAFPAAGQTNTKSSLGAVSGVVHDATGIPQLGATVEVVSEAPGISAVQQFLTNTQGIFRGEKLAPGFYTVRVTLAGFLPTIEKHVRITANLTTVVRVELESMFASIEQLRRPPTNGAAEQDDWKWVLRSASGVRPVLQWNDDAQAPGVLVVENNNPRPRARIELTNGTRRPGSISNVVSAPGTAFAYDQTIDRFNHIVFAGQVSYGDESPAGGVATLWLPTGSAETGPATTIVLREAKSGPGGPVFRGIRLDQGATLALGDRFLLRTGGEYVLVGVGASAWNLRPRVKLETKVSPNWYLDAVYAALPTGTAPADTLSSEFAGPSAMLNNLTTALNALDAFPALLWRSGRPVLENGRHEELAAERKLSNRGVVQMAVFHDDNTHIALFGRGNDLPSADFFQDFYSKGFAYDGGAGSDWGARVALREKISDDLELTGIYAFSGALVPTSTLEGPLRQALRMSPRHSLGANVTAHVPRTRTSLNAGYKWINGSALSRVDPYGESIYQINPYLHVGIRQPLPRFALGRWEASAECDNILAQGYTQLNTGDGPILLVPAFRSFRGGLSLQF